MQLRVGFLDPDCAAFTNIKTPLGYEGKEVKALQITEKMMFFSLSHAICPWHEKTSILVYASDIKE